MAFKPSIVAKPLDPTAAPYLGFPLTEIVLEQDNGEGAVIPIVPPADNRDKILEATDGVDKQVVRRKLNTVEMGIDYISADKKALIERLYHDGRTVYNGLPNPFVATRYHSLIVERETLPECFEVSAWTDDGLIMGLRHKTVEVEGVQFHPESILTVVGKRLLRNFLDG